MKKKQSKWKIFFWPLIGSLFLASYFLIAAPLTIKGDSMAPTLMDQEVVFVVKKPQIERFSIVTFQAPDDENKEYVKRVIGLPGERIEYREDQLYINNQEVSEVYLEEFKQQLADSRLFTENFLIEKVPQNHYFVMGDNRRISKDSRSFGMVSEDAINGKVQFIYWPISKFQAF